MNAKCFFTIDENLLCDSETPSATIGNTEQLVEGSVNLMKSFNAQIVIVRGSDRVACFTSPTEFYAYVQQLHKPKQS